MLLPLSRKSSLMGGDSEPGDSVVVKKDILWWLHQTADDQSILDQYSGPNLMVQSLFMFLGKGK